MTRAQIKAAVRNALGGVKAEFEDPNSNTCVVDLKHKRGAFALSLERLQKLSEALEHATLELVYVDDPHVLELVISWPER